MGGYSAFFLMGAILSITNRGATVFLFYVSPDGGPFLLLLHEGLLYLSPYGGPFCFSPDRGPFYFPPPFSLYLMRGHFVL